MTHRLAYWRWRLRFWKPRLRIFYVCKYDVAQQYGGPEEGGWWFDSGYPVWRFCIPVPVFEELDHMLCRWFNGREHERAEKEEDYGYTSVLSHRSTHYSYHGSDTFRPMPYPTERPHYE